MDISSLPVTTNTGYLCKLKSLIKTVLNPFRWRETAWERQPDGLTQVPARQRQVPAQVDEGHGDGEEEEGDEGKHRGVGHGPAEPFQRAQPGRHPALRAQHPRGPPQAHHLQLHGHLHL